MKPSVRFAKDVLTDASNLDETKTDSAFGDLYNFSYENSSLSQIGFEIESGLTRLDVSVKTLEILLEIEESQPSGQRLVQTPSERQRRVANLQLNPQNIDSISVDQSYLNWLQAELHLTQYRIITLTNIHTKNKQSHSSNANDRMQSQIETCEQQLDTINKVYNHLETMFNSLWKTWVKLKSSKQREMMRRQETKFKNRQISNMFDSNSDKNSNTERNSSSKKKSNENNGSKSDMSDSDFDEKSGRKMLKQGYLTKLGNIRKNWKKRLFILTSDGILRYYSFSNTAKSDKFKKKLLNKIDLSFARKITMISSDSIDAKKYAKPFLLRFVLCVYICFISVFFCMR